MLKAAGTFWEQGSDSIDLSRKHICESAIAAKGSFRSCSVQVLFSDLI
jgi:hypothetical protein